MLAKSLLSNLMLFAFLVKPPLSPPEDVVEQKLTNENLKSPCFSSDGSVQVIVEERGQVEFLETATGRTIAKFVVSCEFLHSSGTLQQFPDVSAVAISSDDRHVAFLNQMGKIQIHELSSGKIVKEQFVADRVSILFQAVFTTSHLSEDCDFTFSPDGKLLALCLPGSGNTDIGIWGYGVVFDLENGTELYTKWGLCAVANMKQGTFLGVRQSNQSERKLQLWNLESNQPIRDFAGEHDFRIQHGAFSPDGELFMAGGLDKLRLWETKTGKLLLDIPLGKKVLVTPGLVITADNRQAMVSTFDYEDGLSIQVRAWQIPEGKLLWANPLFPADLPVTAPFMLPDQQQVGIKLGTSKSFRVWDLKSGKPSK